MHVNTAHPNKPRAALFFFLFRRPGHRSARAPGPSEWPALKGKSPLRSRAEHQAGGTVERLGPRSRLHKALRRPKVSSGQGGRLSSLQPPPAQKINFKRETGFLLHFLLLHARGRSRQGQENSYFGRNRGKTGRSIRTPLRSTHGLSCTCARTVVSSCLGVRLSSIGYHLNAVLLFYLQMQCVHSSPLRPRVCTIVASKTNYRSISLLAPREILPVLREPDVHMQHRLLVR